MIVDRRIGVLLLIRQGIPILLTLFAWDIIVVLVYHLAHQPWMDQPALPYSLIGAALVLFLNMRNNAAYNRWWEARTLWGAIVNNTRSFSRQMASLLGGSPALTKAMIAYTHALRSGLRGGDTTSDVGKFIQTDWPEISYYRNLPNGILQEIGIKVASLCAERRVHPAAHASIDRILSDIANAQGGLERIRNTPLAIQFSVLPGLLVRSFCVVLPLSMVQELGWITPFGSTLVGFLFLALDEIGRDLEDPFAKGDHALPMDAMSRTVEIDLLQSLGETAPDPVQPVRGVLR